MKDLAVFKNFKLFSFLFFITVGLLGLLATFDMFKELHSSNLPGKWMLVSIMIMIAISHLIIGIGLVLENRWCFWGLKIYLYLSLAAFPIGTYISYKILKLIKEYKIGTFFAENNVKEA